MLSGRGPSHPISTSFRPTPVQTNTISRIPPDLTYLFSIRPVKPNLEAQVTQAQNHPQGFFMPPTRRNAFIHDPEIQYRWAGGRITQLSTDDPVRNFQWHKFDVATVFTQRPYTDHLLAVPADAEVTDVDRLAAPWMNLHFHHKPVQSNTRRTYSFLETVAPEQHIAAPGSPTWVGQLLPPVYDYQYTLDKQERQILPSKEHAGLIGRLPLLLALAAFTAPPSYLNDALLGSVIPGGWRPFLGVPDGHIPERGMVITVYHDPCHIQESSYNRLHQLQDGAFGPFYGP